MKLEFRELKPMLEGLKVVLEKEFDDAKGALRLGLAKAQILAEFGPCEQARLKLAEKYARKDEEGNFIELKTDEGTTYDIENVEAFSIEMSDLMKQEITIKYNPISVDMLAGVKGVIGEDIAKLGRLIKDDEDDEATEKAKPAVVPDPIEMPEA